MLTVRSSILAALIVAMLAAWLTPWTVSEGAPSARAGGDQTSSAAPPWGTRAR